MNWSVNHYIEIGDIIRSDNEKIAIADTYEVWERDPLDANKGKFKVVGEATIRISPGVEKVIHSNRLKPAGVVCFLSKEFKGCGILAVKVTHIYKKSVEAIPIDYLQNDEPLDWYWHGETAITLLQQKPDYPNLKRITKP